jgi:hypothetical protein
MRRPGFRARLNQLPVIHCEPQFPVLLSKPNWLFAKQVCVRVLIFRNPDQMCALNSLCIMTVEWAFLLLLYYFVYRFSLILHYFPQSEEN